MFQDRLVEMLPTHFGINRRHLPTAIEVLVVESHRNFIGGSAGRQVPRR